MEPESNQSQRMEAVEKWALFVKNNPDNWKKIHTEFINAQFEKAYKAIDKILKEKGGPEKIAKIYGIKNRAGYSSIFKR